MQARFTARNLGYKNFCGGLVSEVKIEGDDVTRTYRVALETEPPTSGGGAPKKKFFAAFHLVGRGKSYLTRNSLKTEIHLLPRACLVRAASFFFEVAFSL